MSDDKIEIGDLVEVLFSSSQRIEGVIKYIPCSTGDSWIIRSGLLRNDIHYVQTYEQMNRLAQSDDTKAISMSLHTK